MKRTTLQWITLALLLLTAGAEAQPLKLRVANAEFTSMRYADASIHFEQYLATHQNDVEAKMKLAECYRRMKDYKNAMKIYAQLAHEENPSPQNILHYAQSLAINGFYDEAAGWYEKYEQVVPDDQDARHFVNAYKDMKSFYKDSAKYYVQFIPSINSWQSEFSPAYFKNGLIFLSNRGEQEIVRRVFEVDQSSFLDYYFANDTATISEELIAPASPFAMDKSKDHHDDHNIYTSNDTHIPGQYGKMYRFDSVQYHDNHLTKVSRIPHEPRAKYHEGPLTYTRTQDTAYYTRNTPYEKARGEKAYSRFAIYMAHFKNGAWVEEKEISVNTKSYSSGHPSMNKENTKMYFASDRPGGKGGVDIYVVNYDHGVFSEPKNVEEVNTSGNDMFPYVAPNGDLYYATDGKPGLGGLDVFCATMQNNKVVSVKNMGSPFNSRYDDFGILWDNDMMKGFLSSNRKRGFTDDDIYSFKKLCREVSVHVTDSVTGESLDSAYIEMEDFQGYTDINGRVTVCLKPGEHDFKAGKSNYETSKISSVHAEVELPLSPLKFNIIGKITSKEDNSSMEGVRVILTNVDTHTTKEVVTGKDGKYNFPLGIAQHYTVTIAKNACGTTSISRTTEGLTHSTTLKGNMEMLCKGQIIRIDNIYYDFNKYNIRPDAAVELNKLVVLMNQYPDMRIELRSHTDSRGSDKFNMKLSTNRAQAVLDYMASQGVLPSRMRASGYGESVPLNQCTNGVKCSDEEFQLNRRTEFKILSIK